MRFPLSFEDPAPGIIPFTPNETTAKCSVRGFGEEWTTDDADGFQRRIILSVGGGSFGFFEAGHPEGAWATRRAERSETAAGEGGAIP